MQNFKIIIIVLYHGNIDGKTKISELANIRDKYGVQMNEDKEARKCTAGYHI